MVNSLKLLMAVGVVLLIIAISLIGKKLKFFFKFESLRLRKSESFWILLIAVILVIFTLFSEYFIFQPDANWITTPLGLLIFIFGVMFNINVIKQKLKFDVKKSLKYGAEGIYKKIRYPGYSAMMVLFLGLILTLGSLWAFILFVVLLIPALLYRIAQEDAALADMDEDRFEIYTAETKKFIPGCF